MATQRDQGVIVNGRLTSAESTTFDVPVIVDGKYTVSTRTAPHVDRPVVQDGKLTVVTST